MNTSLPVIGHYGLRVLYMYVIHFQTLYFTLCDFTLSLHYTLCHRLEDDSGRLCLPSTEKSLHVTPPYYYHTQIWLHGLFFLSTNLHFIFWIIYLFFSWVGLLQLAHLTRVCYRQSFRFRRLHHKHSPLFITHPSMKTFDSLYHTTHFFQMFCQSS